MVEHARALKARAVPTLIDPSHALPILSGDELFEMIRGAAGYVVNDYEWALTLERTGRSGRRDPGRLCGRAGSSPGASRARRSRKASA